MVAAALLLTSMAQAQTTSPPDPLAPGAAAESAKPEKTEKVSAEKANTEKADAEKTAKPEHEKTKRHHHEAATLAITVRNERSVGLMQLSVVPAGDPNHKKVLGALELSPEATSQFACDYMMAAVGQTIAVECGNLAARRLQQRFSDCVVKTAAPALAA